MQNKNMKTNIIKNESGKKESNKKIKVLISLVLVIMVLLISICSYVILQNLQDIKIISNIKNIEYGESYTPTLKDFVEEKDLHDKYSIDGNIPNEEGKEYPAIGEYKLTVKKNKKCEEVTVKVRDTIAPVFAEDTATTISTVVNTPLDDVTSQFKDKVTDLDEVKVTVNSANVNYSQAGEYKSELIATDESGNTSKKEITVKVTENNATENPQKPTEATNKKPNTTGISNQGNSSSVNKKPNGSSKPSKPSGGGNNGGSSSGSKPAHCTNNGNHSIKCGNMGRWFNSKNELVSYYDKQVKYWNDKVDNGEITNEEYYANVPSGYKCWSCSYCGKWTGDFKYFK